MEEIFLNNKMNCNIKPKVAVIAFPSYSYSPYKFLSEILIILEPISNKIVLIGGNTDRINVTSEKVEVRDIGISMHYIKDIKPTFYSTFLWIIKSILVEVKASLELKKASREVDIVIFYPAYPFYLLPLIVSKLQTKKTIEIVARSRSNSILSKLFHLQDILLYYLIDGISPQSKALIKDLNLEKYKTKLLSDGARFIDTSIYTIKKEINDRKEIVGFIGRITKTKGIVEFVMAIPLLAKENKDIEFLIGGFGDLLDWVKDECMKIEKEYKVKIKIPGWIGQNLPDYLNELKLIVLPSYHEAYPSIILEAMACGTPVLVPPIGAIPSIVKDVETGFIMENNSPESLAKNILNALHHPNLDTISKNARKLIENELSFEKSIKRWEMILNLKVREDL